MGRIVGSETEGKGGVGSSEAVCKLELSFGERSQQEQQVVGSEQEGVVVDRSPGTCWEVGQRETEREERRDMRQRREEKSAWIWNGGG